MSGPGPDKLPQQVYIKRIHKAALKLEAKRLGVPMAVIINDLLDGLVRRVKKRKGVTLTPVPPYKAPWFVAQKNV
jgi:hypothetical protein